MRSSSLFATTLLMTPLLPWPLCAAALADDPTTILTILLMSFVYTFMRESFATLLLKLSRSTTVSVVLRFSGGTTFRRSVTSHVSFVPSSFSPSLTIPARTYMSFSMLEIDRWRFFSMYCRRFFRSVAARGSTSIFSMMSL